MADAAAIPADCRIRLDKWLWYARQTKSRSLAQKLIAGGHVRVNSRKTTNTAMQIGLGDVLTLSLHAGGAHPVVRVLKVVACGERRGPFAEARLLYREPPAGTPQSGLSETPSA